MKVAKELRRKKAFRYGLTTGDVAQICQITRRKAIERCKNESLKSRKVPGSKHRRIAPMDLLTFIRKNTLSEEAWEDIFNPRILLISTNPELEDNIRKLLADRVCRVESAKCELDAGIAIGSHVPACVMLDLHMVRKVAKDIALRIRDNTLCQETILIGLTHGNRINLNGFDQIFDLKTGSNDLADFIMEEPCHA